MTCGREGSSTLARIPQCRRRSLQCRDHTQEGGAGVCARENGSVSVPLTHGGCCGKPKTKNANADKKNTNEKTAAEDDANEEISNGVRREPAVVPRAATTAEPTSAIEPAEGVAATATDPTIATDPTDGRG